MLRVRSLPAAGVATLCLFLTSAPRAQVAWHSVPVLEPRLEPTLTYAGADGVMWVGLTARGVVETWTWDGSTWALRRPATQPDVRRRHSMAYDPMRRRVVLFGGQTTGLLDDTWEWDGSNWTRLTPALRPPARRLPGLAYDASRQRIVLFGGEGAGGALGDMWEWDGVAWTPLSLPALPPARLAMGLAPTQGGLLLYGGLAGSLQSPTPLGDTWLWNGSTWMRQQPQNPPPPGWVWACSQSALGTVLVAPSGGATFLWTGTDWRRLATTADPQGFGQLAFDPVRGRAVWVGQRAETWELAADWRLVAPAASPGRSVSLALARDTARGVSVLLLDDAPNVVPMETWELHGRAWSLRTPPNRPPQRTPPVLSEAPGGVLLFGGGNYARPLGDTWLYDGSDWRAHNPPQAPSPRTGHSLAFDSVRRRVVLFGGAQVNGVLGDTWEWDGAAWHDVTPAAGPSARAGAAMAFDSVRGRTVLFGGSAAAVPLSDTWEWDGTSWLQRITPGTPPARYGVLVFDAARARSVLFVEGQTWEWSGVAWEQRATGMVVQYGVAGFDERRGLMTLYGGDLLGGLWEYGAIHPAAYSAFGAGCAGSAGIPALGAVTGRLPWLGDPFALRVDSLPPGRSGLVWLGTSRTAWGAIMLPLDLTPIGMNGCALRVRPDFTFPFFNLAGNATVSLWIPNDAALIGRGFVTQALVADGGANPFGATTSNGGEGLIGAR